MVHVVVEWPQDIYLQYDFVCLQCLHICHTCLPFLLHFDVIHYNCLHYELWMNIHTLFTLWDIQLKFIWCLFSQKCLLYLYKIWKYLDHEQMIQSDRKWQETFFFTKSYILDPRNKLAIKSFEDNCALNLVGIFCFHVKDCGFYIHEKWAISFAKWFCQSL